MISGNPARSSSRQMRGYAYLMLLVVVAGITTVATYSIEAGAVLHRRGAERELLRIGEELQKALLSYASTRGGIGTDPGYGPHELEDLLRDPRFPGLHRHLRKIYSDPMTGKAQWGAIRGPSGAIVAIYSLAPGVPLQQTGFDAAFSHLELAKSYADWTFGLPQARTRTDLQNMPIGPHSSTTRTPTP